MSHTVKAETKVTDLALLTQVCRTRGLQDPEEGVHTLYQNEHRGHAVSLPGWRYPVVFNMQSGQVVYDNYKGNWGDQKELDNLLVGYSHDFVMQEFQRQNGANIQEFVDEHGWMVMECEIGNAI